MDIQVHGAPEEDKKITVELELHREGEFDAAQAAPIRVFSDKGTFFDLWVYPVSADGQQVHAGHTLRGWTTLSRYAANGYWAPDAITLRDAQGNERHESQVDFGWKLYVNNPLADDEPPDYVKNSMRLSLSKASEAGRPLQILTVSWRIFEETGVSGVYAQLNDASPETYSRRAEEWGEYHPESGMASVQLKVPDYLPSGSYTVPYIAMVDVALNKKGVYFTDPGHALRDEDVVIDEPPATIDIVTTRPDVTPPVLDVNRIRIHAEPTQPEAPNGETRVDIKFRVKDNISGYAATAMYLRDPQGVTHFFRHYGPDFYQVYFSGDPTVYRDYHQTIILPVGSIPGTWGLAEMIVRDKAENTLRVDFTETLRFEVDDATTASTTRYDLNEDGEVNIQDLVQVAQEIGNPGAPNPNPNADINADGTVNILDLVQIANHFGKKK